MNIQVMWTVTVLASMKQRRLETVMGILLIAMLVIMSGTSKVQNVFSEGRGSRSQKTIVIDAGHGGSDPGKIGINNVLEKDINLQIAYKLKMFLEMEDIQVIMTRETEEGLYSADASNKKSDDMKKRCEIIDKANPEFTISIHQNSYHEEEIHGAQVFYYENSEEGKKIAEYIQKQLITRVEPENTRVAKANGSYYLLRKTEKPTVIVECGFLSNYEEAEKLTEDYYQEKLAWAIHMAVMELL